MSKKKTTLKFVSIFNCGNINHPTFEALAKIEERIFLHREILNRAFLWSLPMKDVSMFGENAGVGKLMELNAERGSPAVMGVIRWKRKKMRNQQPKWGGRSLSKYFPFFRGYGRSHTNFSSRVSPRIVLEKRATKKHTQTNGYQHDTGWAQHTTRVDRNLIQHNTSIMLKRLNSVPL